MNPPPVINKVSKADALYIHIAGTQYKCEDCTKFIPATDSTEGKCLEFSKADTVSAKGYCGLWSYGNGIVNVTPRGSWEPYETGYGENPRGTKCVNCVHFTASGQSGSGSCDVVKGVVHRNGCCNLQTPLKEHDARVPRQTEMEIDDFNRVVSFVA